MNGNEDFLNSTYLALELTKLYTSHTDKYTTESIYETYVFYLDKINNILSIPSQQGKIDELVRENDRLRNQLTILKKIGITETTRDSIIEYLNSVKGDMEPYVYKTLMQRLK